MMPKTKEEYYAEIEKIIGERTDQEFALRDISENYLEKTLPDVPHHLLAREKAQKAMYDAAISVLIEEIYKTRDVIDQFFKAGKFNNDDPGCIACGDSSQVACDACQGTGLASPPIGTCAKCHGSGVLTCPACYDPHEHNDTIKEKEPQPNCWRCLGKGMIVGLQDKNVECPECCGSGSRPHNPPKQDEICPVDPTVNSCYCVECIGKRVAGIDPGEHPDMESDPPEPVEPINPPKPETAKNAERPLCPELSLDNYFCNVRDTLCICPKNGDVGEYMLDEVPLERPPKQYETHIECHCKKCENDRYILDSLSTGKRAEKRQRKAFKKKTGFPHCGLLRASCVEKECLMWRVGRPSSFAPEFKSTTSGCKVVLMFERGIEL